MIIDDKMLNALADLSRLEISKSDKENISVDLNSILSYFEILNSIDLPKTQLNDDIDIRLRNDIVVQSYDRNEILQNASSRSEEVFIIPKAID